MGGFIPGNVGTGGGGDWRKSSISEGGNAGGFFPPPNSGNKKCPTCGAPMGGGAITGGPEPMPSPAMPSGPSGPWAPLGGGAGGGAGVRPPPSNIQTQPPSMPKPPSTPNPYEQPGGRYGGFMGGQSARGRGPGGYGRTPGGAF